MERGWDTQSGDDAESHHRTPVAILYQTRQRSRCSPRGLWNGVDYRPVLHTNAEETHGWHRGDVAMQSQDQNHKEILALQRSFENNMSV
jgi:hypothetical protein